jgi:hypothetical protein
MKNITVLMLALISSITHAQTDGLSNFYTSTEFNIDAGRFRVFQLSDWEVGEGSCWEYTINKAYNSTEWLASGMLVIRGNRDSKFAKIAVGMKGKDSDEIRVSFLNAFKKNKKTKKIKEIVFFQGLKIGEPFKFSFVVTKKNVVEIRSNKKLFSFPLGYSPNNVAFGASSSNTTIKQLKGSECKN